VQVLAAHCVLKQSSEILASPGTMLAPALSTDREQHQQYILTPASAKAAPAQRHARHCSICGAVRHTHRRACTHAHTHAHRCTHTRMRMHTHIHKRARVYRQAQTHIHMHTHKYTRAHSYKHPNTQAQAHAHTHTHTLTRARAYACTLCARDGLCQISCVASDAPDLSY
jgi:hypothetical protein